MAFIPRLTDAGIRNNPKWYSDNPFYQSGWGLPNCTCYAYGRWYELLGTKPTFLPLGDAGTWWNNFPSNIQKGQTPELGAIACWYDPYGYYAGHVAVVEEIYSPTHILTSNSGYQGTFFFTEDNYQSNDWIGASISHRPYRFQGFAYLPGSTPGQTWEWIKGNYYLSQNECDNNAYITAAYLSSKGWSLEAICGLLGNFYRESTINPGIWESLIVDPSNGYGLAQWTPSTKWTNYAAAHGLQIDDGYRQLDFLDQDPIGDYIPTSAYPESLAQYKALTNSPEYCASAWLYNYERAGVVAEDERRFMARYYYNILEDIPTLPPVDGGGEIRSMKPWMMIRYVY